MPRYLVKRTWGEVTDAELVDNARRGLAVRDEGFGDIDWEHSHVVVDDAGQSVSYCVYGAPSAARLRAHAEATGGHFVDEIVEIAGDISPADLTG